MEKSLLIRQIAYRLFASLFLYPEVERLTELRAAAQELLTDGLLSGHPYSPQMQALLESLAALDPVGDERPLVNEYNRLFMVRPQAPPHETVYMDSEGQFRGMLTAELETTYRQVGLTVSPTLNELPDHIAVELEFMAYLCLKESEAQQDGSSTTDALRWRGLQAAFVKGHLARWFPLFARRLKEAQPVGLYAALLPAVYAFLSHELYWLGLR